VLATTTFALLRANSTHVFHASSLTITHPTMSVISTMVGRRELLGCQCQGRKLITIRQAGGPGGIASGFGLALCRGLQDCEPVRAMYAMSALAAAGEGSLGGHPL
jgi:hypothetical protein